MAFEAKNFDNLLGLAGFSDNLLKNHFTLYQGYVANTNKICDAVDALLKSGKAATPEFAELKRRFGWEFNGMRLHELYFGNLSKIPSKFDSNSKIGKRIIADFGSFENFEKDFKPTGLMRGIGWVVLYQETSTERLFCIWVNEHDAGHLAGCRPLLVMDVFEHAFMLDYGLKKADYIEAFWKAVDWSAVEKRL